jgi:hypothetical protein
MTRKELLSLSCAVEWLAQERTATEPANLEDKVGRFRLLASLARVALLRNAGVDTDLALQIRSLATSLLERPPPSAAA